MGVFAIPLSEDPFQTVRTLLDGEAFILAIDYNQRGNHFMMSISDDNGNLLVSSLKIVCNYMLLERLSDKRLPRGELVAFAMGADTSPPGLGELGIGKRVELTYFDHDELIAAGAI